MTSPSEPLVVMTSGGLAAAHLQLAPAAQAQLGRAIDTKFGSSMGPARDSIPARLARGEHGDVFLMVEPALQRLAQRGVLDPDTCTPLAQSTVAVAVRRGLPLPDISTPQALRQALLAAPSIAYSASASGRYIGRTLLPRLGIAEQVAGRCREVLSERVGAVLARGEADLGFQQHSELLPIEGIEIVGPLPAPLQCTTVYGVGVATATRDRPRALALARFLATPLAQRTYAACGLNPLGPTDEGC